MKALSVGNIARFRSRWEKDDRAILPEFGDVLLLLYLWFVVILLCSIANVSNLDLPDISLFIGIGGSTLTACAALLAVRRRDGRVLMIGALCVYAALVMLPAFVFTPSVSQRMVFLDLYFMMFVATPALLQIWPWQWQCIAGVLAVVADLLMWLPSNSWLTFLSLSLVATTAALSSLVAFVSTDEVRSRERREERQGWLRLDLMLREKLPQRIWSVVLLEAGLLVVLFFLDVVLWRKPVFSLVVLGKTYGLVLLIISSLVIVIAKAQHLEAIATLTTIITGISLSVSAIGAETSVVYGVSPLIYLLFVAIGLFGGLTTQVVIAWSVLAADVLARAVRPLANGMNFFDTIEVLLLTHRGAVCLLVLGGAVSVLVSRFLRRYQASSIAYFLTPDAANGTAGCGTDGVPPAGAVSHGKLAASCQGLDRPERLQRLVLGTLVIGVVACLIASKLLLSHDISLWKAAVAGWGIFFLLWVTLLYFERSGFPHEQLWFFGAFLVLLLFLWPSMLFVTVIPARLLWIIWPLYLFMTIGVIPWGLKELITLVAVASIAGVEIVYRLNLGIGGTVAFLLVTLLSVLYSTMISRHLKERALLRRIHDLFGQANDEQGALRILVDALMDLFGSGSALISLSRDHLELLRGGMFFSLTPDQWPLENLREKTGRVAAICGPVAMGAINWLPQSLSLFDRRFGVFSACSGFVVEIDATRINDSAANIVDTGLTKRRPVAVFLAFPHPFVGWLRQNRIETVRALAEAALMRLAVIRAEDDRCHGERIAESVRNEREYELSALVHDINNTVQDLTLLCDVIHEDLAKQENAATAGAEHSEEGAKLIREVERIALIARSVATTVSDAKRKRELEKLEDLSPRELVEVTAVLEEICAFSAIRAERKRIDVRAPDWSKEKLWVRVSDREHLETILRNLLNNAILYSDPGSTVRVVLRAEERWLSIDVIDNGAGLSADECEEIFRSGYRGAASKGVRGGLGVGLAQSRRVAESAGGTLTAQSAGPGRGSTFTVSLPRQAEPKDFSMIAPWALMVDDQPALAEFYSRLAKAVDLAPAVATTLGEAIAIVERRGKPSFVLTDIHLGSGDGFELIRYIRREFGKDVPLLVVSGLSDSDIVDKAYAAGATDFVAKPVGRRALFARIQSMLSGK